MLKQRSPIVTILGHVDHGKTTLLDALRKSNVAGKEAGGITQSIGASVVGTKDGRVITFIDTPGHAAFTQMRSRGANVCDIAVLIVAADDGVKPQTKEALEIIQSEKLPFIVCLTKIDLPSSDTEMAILSLEKEGVTFEGRGGNTPYVKVSAKKNEGLEELVEIIALVADMNDLSADEEGKLDAFVVETKKDQRGSMASVIIRDGKLRVGQKIYSDAIETKVRGLFDHTGQPVREIAPGFPGLVLGFEKMPAVGAVICSFPDTSVMKVGEKQEFSGNVPHEVKLNLVIKAQSSGCLEAILSNIPPSVGVIASGVGDIIEADVFTAKSAKNCKIFAFEVKASNNIFRLADTEGVKIETFNIIYKLFERIEEILKNAEEEIFGEALIIASFPYENKKVAGCKVIKGKIAKEDQLKLTRGGKVIGNVKITSMKKEKKDISEAKQGEEFGLIMHPQLDFTIGDVLISSR